MKRYIVFVMVIAALGFYYFPFSTSAKTEQTLMGAKDLSSTEELSKKVFSLIMKYQLAEAEKMLDMTDKIDAIKGANGETLLHRAAELGTPRLLEKILEKIPAVSIDAKDNYGATPLMYAIRTHNVATVKKLLDIGADTTNALNRALDYKQRSISMDFGQMILSDFDRIIEMLQAK